MASDLKLTYSSATEDEAHLALESFDEGWSEHYPNIAKTSYNNLENLVIFLQFPENIRKIIYTTTVIELINRQIRKIIKNKGVYPDDKSIQKIIFLSLTKAQKKWTMPIRD